MAVIVFEQDCMISSEELLNYKCRGGLDRQFIKDFFSYRPDDTFTITVEIQNDSIYILQAVEDDSGETWKFIQYPDPVE